MGATCSAQTKEILVNSFRKGQKKMARVISKTQVSNPGPSWPSCSTRFLEKYGYCLDCPYQNIENEQSSRNLYTKMFSL